MKKKTKTLLIILAIVIAAIVAFLLIRKAKSANQELVIRTHVVSEYTVENTVTATGTIEPVETVEVGTQVSGKVEKIYVDFNSVVKKGELMAELDKLTLSQNVSKAKANLTSAESQLKYAKLTYDRTKQLYESNAATLAAFQEAQNTYVQAQTNKQNAQANYDQTLVDLGYAEIYSPIDGVVLDRAVEVGQTVAASFSTPTLFTMANDLTKMQVEADVDEADIGRIVVGQKVTFTVDSYADEVFDGTVNQVRMQPTTTNNVVTYTVIIEAPNPKLELFPGMTASVTIITESNSGLAVPAEALSFTPSDQILKSIRKSVGKPSKEEMAAHQQHDSMGGGPAPSGDSITDQSMVWIKQGTSMMPRPVKAGISDGAYTIIESGLNEGDSVVLSAQYVEKAKTTKQGSNPFMPSPPKGGGGGGGPR